MALAYSTILPFKNSAKLAFHYHSLISSSLYPPNPTKPATHRLTRSKAELKFKVAAELVVLEKTMLALGLGGGKKRESQLTR